MFSTAGRGKGLHLEPTFDFFLGVDWGAEKHRVCLMNREGTVIEERWTQHNAVSIAELITWLRDTVSAEPAALAVAIEPRGAIVETLTESGFPVFSINPKQLDRFRGRYSPAGAKDDSRDAFVLADSLRTDQHCFRGVRLNEPAVIRLRELSRLDYRLWPRASRRKISPKFSIATESDGSALKRSELFWPLFPLGLPTEPQKRPANMPFFCDLSCGCSVSNGVASPPASEKLLEELAALPPAQREAQEHRDAKILLSLPGVGGIVAATMLSEASQAIADRDYHALRCYAGTAPITRQSGKKTVVSMRYSCNERLRNALYHWARVSTIRDPHSRAHYAQLRAKGHSHGGALRGLADRWVRVFIAMLKHHTLYDPALHGVPRSADRHP
jgi:transposase/transposase IS116/IS110/IS902 family protein